MKKLKIQSIVAIAMQRSEAEHASRMNVSGFSLDSHSWLL